MLYDKELLNRPKILIVTKLDKKGATSRFQELKQRVNSVQEHGKPNAEGKSPWESPVTCFYVLCYKIR